MPYKKRGKRDKLLDLARKSRERAQARRRAKELRVGGKRYITPVPEAKAKSKAKAAVIKRGDTTITYKPKPSPHLKSKPTHGRVIPKDITGRAAKPSMVKPPIGKKTTKPAPKPTKKPTPPVKTSAKKPLSPTMKRYHELAGTLKKPLDAYAKLLEADKTRGFVSSRKRNQGGDTISARPSKNFLQRGPERRKAVLDYLFPKHRGIGQSQTGYSRAGAGDVGIEVGKKALDAWLKASGAKAVWGGVKQIRHAPGLWKKMQPWRTGGKPIMSKEFIKTLGGKNLKSFMEFVKREKSWKEAFPKKAPRLSKREQRRRSAKGKETRAKTEADRVEAVAKNKAAAKLKANKAAKLKAEKLKSEKLKAEKLKADSAPKTPAKKTPAKKKVAEKKTPAKAPAKKAVEKKATKPINKPYQTPTIHPLKSWKAPAAKKTPVKKTPAKKTPIKKAVKKRRQRQKGGQQLVKKAAKKKKK